MRSGCRLFCVQIMGFTLIKVLIFGMRSVLGVQIESFLPVVILGAKRANVALTY